MYYTIWELLFFFFVYSFLGWAARVAAEALRSGHFVNAGLLNGPVSVSSGTVVTLLALLSTQYATNYLGQYILAALMIPMVTSCFGFLSERVLGRKLWDYNGQNYSAFGGKKGLLRTLLLALAALTTVALLHPFLYIFCHIVPTLALQIADWVLLALLACDLTATLWAMRVIKRRSQLAEGVSVSLQDARMTWGSRIVAKIRNRLWWAFPDLSNPPENGGAQPQEGRVFAQGLCLYKVFWMFLICALVGDWIETVYVWLTAGILMSRSSLLYGTFSVVWGLGGVLFTIVLHPLRERNDRFIFLGGFLLGGAYEYLCSVFTEIVFGTVFWDYSDMPFNIQGRTNLLFMFFWGVLALVWVKAIYPPVNRWIEKLPPLLGTVLTWCLAVFMVCNTLISGLAMARYVARAEGTAGAGAVGQFLDNQYPDELVEWVWPNLEFVEE